MNNRPVHAVDLPVIAVTFTTTFNAAPWSEAWTEETSQACLRDLLALPGTLALVTWDGPMCLGAAFG